MDRILEKLRSLYGDKADIIYPEINNIINNFQNKKIREEELTEKDVVLITYGDQFRGDDKYLRYLKRFCDEFFKGYINTIHILPFFPYSSDDGFSVIDYRKVKEDLGDWEDIEDLSKDYKLMFDFVCNHISSKSEWFQGYLKGDKRYKDYFIEMDPDIDLSNVVRPRALPLLTPFDTRDGKKYLWTTFSADQIDLNYKSPKLLLDMIKILLFYIERGADIIRLDAIAYLWKEIGTPCVHLRETHTVVQLFRDILDRVAPEVKIITETNVPHKDNISYFGDGYNEAQLVYQFPLPPLILYTFKKHDSTAFNAWAKTIKPFSPKTTYFNFLASHDGIGLNPLRGIVDEKEIENLVEITERRGGLVSYKYNPNGTKSPYELNISYFNALSDEDEDEEIKIKKFINTYGIILVLQGVPGIYIHSILGSENYYDGVKTTGQNRSINREKFDYERIREELKDKNSRRYRIYSSFIKLLDTRKNSRVFSPNSEQEILELDNRVIAISRRCRDEKLLAIHNITPGSVSLKIDIGDLELDPYEFVWLRYSSE